MMVGEGETQKDDRDDGEEGDFQETNHASLIRSGSRERAS
jgi:hypothetical protein